MFGHLSDYRQSRTLYAQKQVRRAHDLILPYPRRPSQSRSALSTSSCCPSPGSEGVERPLRGELVVIRGELVPVLGVSNPIGVTEPLGGTGILMSSGEPGTNFSGRPGILILVASLL